MTISEYKLDICSGCDSLNKVNLIVTKVRFCGKPLITKFDSRGNIIECGCLLKIKTKVKGSNCPQNKW